MRIYWIIFLLAIIANSSFGTFWKLVVQQKPVYQSIPIFIGLGAILCGFVWSWIEGVSLQQVFQPPKVYAPYLIAGAVSAAVFYCLFSLIFRSEALSTAYPVLSAGTVVITAIVGKYLFHDRIPGYRLLGIGLAVISILLIKMDSRTFIKITSWIKAVFG